MKILIEQTMILVETKNEDKEKKEIFGVKAFIEMDKAEYIEFINKSKQGCFNINIYNNKDNKARSKL